MTAATASPAALHTAFYKFVRLAQPESMALLLRELTAREQLMGSVLVAPEGINGMLAGAPQAVAAAEHALLTDPCFEGLFAGTVFKRSACKTVPFHKMKVHVKAEIVPLGIAGVDASRQSGTNLSPQAWRELIKQDDVVLLDNRNSFEFRLGRFDRAIDPQVGNFRDFPAYVLAHAPAWKAAGKRVAMYCTGGIRCDNQHLARAGVQRCARWALATGARSAPGQRWLRGRRRPRGLNRARHVAQPRWRRPELGRLDARPLAAPDRLSASALSCRQRGAVDSAHRARRRAR